MITGAVIGGFFLGLFIGGFMGWLTALLMVHAGRESDAERQTIELVRTVRCQHPGACERTDDGYCGRCHQELYP